VRPQLQRRVQRYGWDKASAYYEGYWRDPILPAQDRLLDMAELACGERVLDVACGTGLVTLRAARAVGATGEVVGTDVSDEMVKATQRVVEEQGLENVRTERMGAETLSLSDASFDVALCALGLMYVPDPVLALREMLRVLRPGGRCVAAVWGSRDRCGWAEIFPIVDSRVSTQVCPLFFQLGTGDALEFAFGEAGFSVMESDRIPTALNHKTAEDAWGAAFLGGPVAMAYSRFDEPTRNEAHREYLESIEPYREGESYAIPGEFVIARGVKAG
jgi:ubiquinone/menaquinone biosynthesis C-methylase UbiE